jgi:uncharacterized paraquat-inducible protein A
MLTRLIIRGTLEAVLPALVVCIVLNHNAQIHPAIGFTAATAFIVWMSCSIRIRRLRRLVREAAVKYYHHQRPPFCLHCGYDLRELTSAKCPECGIPLPSPQR